jgi:hypothetical protein
MVRVGLIDGAGRGQGRRRTAETAGEEIAEFARDNAQLIKTAFRDALSSGNERTRLMAAKELLRFEQLERDRQASRASRDMLDDEELSSLNGDELTERLLELLPAQEERPWPDRHNPAWRDTDCVDSHGSLRLDLFGLDLRQG